MSERVSTRQGGRDLWEGIRSEPGRVGLSFLAVAIGIAALMMLLAVLDGLRWKAQRLVDELGAQVIAILPAPRGGPADPVPLRSRDLDLLRAQLSGCRIAGLRRYEVSVPGEKNRVTVLATDECLVPVRGWRVETGRNLDRLDVRNGERHAVISGALAAKWRVSVGDVVTLQQVPFRIVGLAAIGGGGLEQEIGDRKIQTGEYTLLVPITAPVAWDPESREVGQRMDGVFIQAPPGGSLPDILATAQRLVDRPAAGTLSWVTPEVLLRGVRHVQQAVRLAGGSIAFLCLILGGSTLMSLMVANVRDRVTEIGLRRALGATPRDIARLFIAEACLVTGAAAVAGSVITGVLVGVVRQRFEAVVRLEATSLLAPVLVALALGVLFSWWPARLAARISPAEALRNE